MERVNRRELRRLRIAAGYTQEEMARMANISLRRYVDIETKTINPHLATIAAIAQALCIHVADLLEDDS